MGWLQDFLGDSARDDIAAGAKSANANLDAGLNAGTQSYADAGRSAASRLDAFKTYADAGTASAKRYADATGVNGVDAQRAVQQEYMNDPLQNMLMDRITRANTRAFTATGMNNSGAATTSLTNNLLDNWRNYQTSLKTGADLGQMGLTAASGQAGIDQATGQAIGDAQISTANQKAGIDTSQANATAGTRSTGINNLLNIASLGVQAYTGRPKVRA